MDPGIARRLWQVLEPYHAVVYFAPEKKEHFDAAGLRGGWMGYFATRAAPLGPVPAEVVIATFYNFAPGMVRRAIPDAWRFSSPEKALAARYSAADAALRRFLGDAIEGEDVKVAAELARRAAESSSPEGRPLFAAHASLEWPTDPHLVLWHAATLLREFRGDGHVAALLTHEIGGLEAHVLVAAAGITPGQMLRDFRKWSDDEWDAAVERMRARGLVGPDDSLTDAGRKLRAEIEEQTDRLALPSFLALGRGDTEELERRLRPLVASIHAASGIVYPNPIGLEAPPG